MASIIGAAPAPYAQNPIVFNFKSVSTSYTIRNEKGNIIHEENRAIEGIPVILDYDNKRLEIQSAQPISLKLFALMHDIKEDNGDKTQTFAAIDISNIKCVVVFTILHKTLKSGELAIIDISYPKSDLIYGLKF